MNLNKPFYLSMTIISALVSGVTQMLNLFGVSIADLAPAITAAIGKEINATVSIAGVVLAIIGRFRATKQVTLGPTPSPTNRGLLLPFLALGGVMASVTLVGCGSAAETYTYTPAGASTPVVLTGFAAWCENDLGLITSSTKITAQAGAAYLIKQGSTRIRIAGYAQSIINLLRGLLGQSAITSSQLQTAAAPVLADNNDGIASQIGEPLINLVGGWFVTLEATNTPAKVSNDVVAAVIAGLQPVVTEYSAPTST
jgi:hypothetical protein